MHYHPDDFIGMLEEIENTGGALLPDPCVGKLVSYKVKGLDGRDHIKKVETTGCGMDARFIIPYDSSTPVKLNLLDSRGRAEVKIDHEGETKTIVGPEFATVCAVDDAVGLWPRFIHTMKSGESYQPLTEGGGADEE